MVDILDGENNVDTMAAKWESQKKGYLDDSEWIHKARSISQNSQNDLNTSENDMENVPQPTPSKSTDVQGRVRNNNKISD